MDANAASRFGAGVWQPALEKYGAVTHLSVVLYGKGGEPLGGPIPRTPLCDALLGHGFDPGTFAACAALCLEQVTERPAVVLAPDYGLGVVGAALVLEGEVVGAAVAGYALVDFPSAAGIERLAREARLPFRALWDVARRQQPVPRRRLKLHGELLQVLGDSLLRENHRTRQYEETNARLQAEAAAKDEFLAVLSHELRTPLSPILNWARILEQRAEDPDMCRRAASSIERNARLQAKLVDDLLDLHRVARGDDLTLELAKSEVTALLRSAVESTAEAAAAKGISLELADSPGPLVVNGDAGRLQQVFLNVLSNSVKFTPAGGRVRSTIGREEDAAVVRIADSGDGIAPSFLPHVFEMFRQQESGTRRRHPGLGIGLALVKRLVELHGGTVELRSAGVGQGTTATIRLPLIGAEPDHLARDVTDSAPAPIEPRPLTGLTILVVEDTIETLESTSVLLETLGARVLHAGDGQEALEVVERIRPDLILCDLRMPRMDGFEFVRELDRLLGPSHPPVIAVSGLGGEADFRRTGAAGFVGHLVKPADDAAIVSAVRAASRD